MPGTYEFWDIIMWTGVQCMVAVDSVYAVVIKYGMHESDDANNIRTAKNADPDTELELAHGGKETIPRTIERPAYARRRVLLRTRLALDTRDGADDMFDDEVFRRFVADLQPAGRAGVRRLRRRFHNHVNLALDLSSRDVR